MAINKAVQYRHRISNDHAGTSGKVSPLFGNKTGRIRRKRLNLIVLIVRIVELSFIESIRTTSWHLDEQLDLMVPDDMVSEDDFLLGKVCNAG